MTEAARMSQDLALAARDRAGEHPTGAGFWPFIRAAAS